MVFNLPAIEQAFLDAAVDPTRWDAAMDTVSLATQSYGSIIIPFPRGAQPFLPTSTTMAPCIESYIRGGWYMRDERERALPRIRRLGIAVDDDVMPEDEIARSPFYQEALAPFKLRWFAGVRMMADDDFWCIAIQRHAGQLPFSADEQRQLTCLSQRLTSVGTLARALGNGRAEAALAAFDVSSTAAVMINRLGDAVRWNEAAEKLYGADLQIVRNRLTPADRDAAVLLERALHDLLWSTTPSVLSEPVLLRRKNGAGILAYPLRLEGVSRDALAPCRAMVLLRDLAARAMPAEEALRSSFGLTTAEARLASRIACGDTLAAVAGRLCIAKQTARNQLKAVFAKTGVGRQSELVVMLAQILANIRK